MVPFYIKYENAANYPEIAFAAMLGRKTSTHFASNLARYGAAAAFSGKAVQHRFTRVHLRARKV
jgi:hypothetical protein